MKLNKDEIYKLLDEGKGPSEISKILGCVRSLITYHKNRRNSPERKGKNIPFSKEQIERINSLYLEGNNFSEIGDITGYSLQTIRKYLNVPRRKKEKVRGSYYKLRWEIRKKAILVTYKGGKCQKCGYDKCIEALHFHHVNPEEKEFNVCSASYSIERLKKEADKCILLCANCHVEEHNCKTCEEALISGKKLRKNDKIL